MVDFVCLFLGVNGITCWFGRLRVRFYHSRPVVYLGRLQHEIDLVVCLVLGAEGRTFLVKMKIDLWFILGEGKAK